MEDQKEFRKEWLGERRRYIGSSDAAGIFGCGYANQTRYSVWMSKIDSVEATEDREADLTEDELELMREGARNEKFVIQAFRDRNEQFEVIDKAFDLRLNPEYPNLCASLDAYAIDLDCLEFPVEAKWIMNPSRKIDGEWVDEWADGRCPLKYQFQVLHQMIVMGARRGVVVAFVRGKYTERWINWDQDAVDWMLSEYATFWSHVESRTRPPEPDKIELEVREVVKGTAIFLGSEDSEIVREIVKTQEIISQKQARVDVLLGSLSRRIGSSEYVMLDDGTAAKLHKQSIRMVRKLPRGVRNS